MIRAEKFPMEMQPESWASPFETRNRWFESYSQLAVVIDA
jgi:hypothetical protein